MKISREAVLPWVLAPSLGKTFCPCRSRCIAGFAVFQLERSPSFSQSRIQSKIGSMESTSGKCRRRAGRRCAGERGYPSARSMKSFRGLIAPHGNDVEGRVLYADGVVSTSMLSVAAPAEGSFVCFRVGWPAVTIRRTRMISSSGRSGTERRQHFTSSCVV